MKRLAAVILRQRTEVETFFLDALSQVKAEVATRRRDALANGDRAALSPLHRAGVSVLLQQQAKVTLSSSTSRQKSTLTAGSKLQHQGHPTPTASIKSIAALTLTVPAGGVLPAGVTLPQLVSHGQRPQLSASAGTGVLGATVGAPAPAAPAAAVDVSELSPEDREQVLRLLFAKIHHVGSQRRMPKSILPLVPPPTTARAGLAASPASTVASREVGNDGTSIVPVSGPFGLFTALPDSLGGMVESRDDDSGGGASSRAMGSSDGPTGIAQTARAKPDLSTGSQGAGHASRDPAALAAAALPAELRTDLVSQAPSDEVAELDADIQAFLQRSNAALGGGELGGAVGDSGAEEETSSLAESLLAAASERELVSRAIGSRPSR